ncbi:tyrosine-type recombinase/integrase [Pseudomonas sp. 65/3-MNA-CIBAN-0223]|uniref:tyrosine-type recombinase/integrase n=1 Tax=Pseudomonas sp. 65/3-MNA-CIBAN-0223 TaxID=3140476 RepID=UPI003320498C
MPFSDIFHPECDPLEPDDAPHHMVFSCLQWKSPNLEVMPQATKQRIAVIYTQPLDQSFIIETLERAYRQDALSGVRLVGAHKDMLNIFLSNDVASSTFPAIESLWSTVKKMDRNQRLEVSFACENELYSGRSDYPFWPLAKEILEEHFLVIGEDRLPPFALEADGKLTDENMESQLKTERFGLCTSPTQTRRKDIPCVKCGLGSSVDNLSPKDHLKHFKPTPFNQSELEAIRQAVKRAGNLRDECLHEFLLMGLRVNALREMKAGDVLNFHSQVKVKVLSYKRRLGSSMVVLTNNAATLITRYLEATGLSKDDFLFPSDKDNKRPISLVAMKRIFCFWLIDAVIDNPQRPLNSIRQSVTSTISSDPMTLVSNAMGHSAPEMYKYYLSLLRIKRDT